MDNWQWWLAYGVIGVSLAGGLGFALFSLCYIVEAIYKGIKYRNDDKDYDWGNH